jgi:hypothetical protein
MFCPTCGSEATTGESYCRRCGVNLAFVSKAVGIGDAVARGDTGLLPRIKSMVGNLQLDDVSREVGAKLDAIGREMEAKSSKKRKDLKKPPFSPIPDEAYIAVALDERESTPFWKTRPETIDERRARHLSEGIKAFFGGVATIVVLYLFGSAAVLKIPPDVVAKIPFELDPMIRIAWVLGLFPLLSAVGHFVAALSIGSLRSARSAELPRTAEPLGNAAPPRLETPPTPISFDERDAPPSVVEHTTRELDAERPGVRPAEQRFDAH